MEKVTKRGELSYHGKKLTIYSTKDYTVFKRQKANRAKEIWTDPVKNKHVAALRDSMEESLLFTMLIVNKQMEVIDGQHRLAALRLLGGEVYFIVIDNYNGEETKIFNISNRNWSSMDYCLHHSELGKPDYTKAYNYVINGSISLSALIRLANNTQNFVGFKQGDFKADWTTLDNDIAMLQDFPEELRKKFLITTSHEVSSAFQILFRAKEYDHNYFVNKIGVSAHLLKPTARFAIVGFKKLMIANQLLKLYNLNYRGRPLELYPDFYTDLGKEI